MTKIGLQEAFFKTIYTFGICIFGHCYLLDICDLELGISIIHIAF